MREIWRQKFSSVAYYDQTGRPQRGTVVFEQILVTETEERYDVDDGYSVHPNLGRVYVAEDGRRFRLHPETVDYSGGTHIREIDAPEGQEGYWHTPPWLSSGFVYEDGSAPVRYLMLDDAELAKRREKSENRRRAQELRVAAARLERA